MDPAEMLGADMSGPDELVDKLVQDDSDWLFAPESLEDIRCRLSFIEASECNCTEGPHENALHDLVDDDVPVLLRVIERLAAELEQAQCTIRALVSPHPDSEVGVPGGLQQ